MHEQAAAVRRVLSDAPAFLLVERLAEHLAKDHGITATALFLVDYRLSELLPVHGGPPERNPGSILWRSFDHQAEVVDGRTLVLPVTTRGDRLGVLRLDPVPDDRAVHAAVAEAATALAHELAAVWNRTDRYAVAARSRRLTLAAEMQWELLPGRGCTRSTFSLAGQLEPAYAVRGDSFDWADDPQRLRIAVVNGMGEGVAAATLTVLAINALRNARRAGLALVDQAALADQAIYAHYGGEQHVEALLIEVELATGEATVIDAGSPQMILLRDGRAMPQRLDAQFPLGMFEDTVYQPQRLSLRTGDRLFVVSDGVVDAASAAGRYGALALDRFIGRTRAMSPLDAVRSLLGDLRAFVSGDLIDDAVVVCLDWTGLEPQA
ncbi:MAG TPA: PP2C family protein-serine/threonine phosphatase [Micromonosporaceae bacterium]|nr:PP2C family protein-serine/threonine phosphatase [Micromonosporaceae bacterium]